MSYKKYKKPRESDIYLPKANFMTLMSDVPKDRCYRNLGMDCKYEHHCNFCYMADYLRRNIGNDPAPYPIIDHLSCFIDKAKVKYSYYQKVVAVKPEVLLRFDKKQLLYYQFFKCTDGPGCIPGNDVWEVDGYFLSHPDEPITLRRMDIIGIPMLHACKKYDTYFFANTVRECGYLEGGGV